MSRYHFRLHCDQRMAEKVVEMCSGNTHHHFTCHACGYQEREVRTRSGSLISWRNLSRLAREAQPRV